jgi:hypothetical protein
MEALKLHGPLPDADHYIYHSNEADVVRAMDAFLAKLS